MAADAIVSLGSTWLCSGNTRNIRATDWRNEENTYSCVAPAGYGRVPNGPRPWVSRRSWNRSRFRRDRLGAAFRRLAGSSRSPETL